MLKKLFNYVLLSLPVQAFAAAPTQDSGLGEVASNLMEPVGVFSNFLGTACLFFGGCFLFAALIKYIEHRRSPLMVTFSTVVFLLIAGIIFILLPFAYLITGEGVPYFLFRK
ncbi:MAG TPA: hypothetical protein VNC84_04525 [Gammaproteobacteria bacterium]|jgi:hypothetical protein|nr:hypothetical protein [Gammaproteobacteria bacterium]